MRRANRSVKGRRSHLSLSSPPKLREVWPFIDWLDRAQFSSNSNPLIAGPVFQRLTPANKVLTHWLAYVLDAQTDFRRLWAYGGPIFAEFVEHFLTDPGPPLDVLTAYVAKPIKDGAVATLVAKQQLAKNEIDAFGLEITPRYPWMLFSIGTTLLTLSRFERSLVAYIAAHETFLLQGDGTELGRRTAYLLYLLTYWKIPNRVRHPNTQSFKTSVRRHSEQVMKLLGSDVGLENAFEEWKASSRRFHKRLWAGLRDYIKLGAEFQGHFSAALAKHHPTLAAAFARDPDSILIDLEVPGDVWNLRFFTRLLGPNIKPSQLRVWFDDLRARKELPNNAAVERFDISFRFSPAMCDLRREGCCIFREASDIWQLCPPRRGVPWQGSACPVTDHLCGIHYACQPDGCPVRQRPPSNLCAGCKIDIRELQIGAV